MEKTQRQSNFELLRLVAMFLIVLHHFCVHGIFSYWSAGSSGISHFNTYACEFLSIGGKIGVDIFVLITGFFMVNSDFKLEKALNLYLKTLFYSLLIMLFIAACDGFYIPSKLLNHSLFPIGSDAYWFISRYLFLYMLSPFINIFIKNASEKMHLYLIIFLGLFWSILPTFTSGVYSYSTLGWFVFLYILGAYIKLYPKKIYDNNKINIVSLLSLCLLEILILLGFNHSEFVDMWKTIKYMNEYTLFILLMSLNIFFIFKNLDIKSKFINWMATSVLAVYLIHDNEFVRPLLWRYLLHVVTYMDSHYFVLWAFFISFSVFIICILIDKVFNLVFCRLIKKISNLIKNFLCKIADQ